MEKKTMGSFMAALRKANGLTQQQVADKLNVSNKTISKWECNEGYPEITMLPVIAELYSVSVDELLRGEKTSKTFTEESKDAKSDERIKYLIEKASVKFTNNSIISIVLGIVSAILAYTVGDIVNYNMLWVSYIIILILSAASISVSLISFNNLISGLRNEDIVEKETFENAIKKCIKHISIIAFLTTVSFLGLILNILFDGPSFLFVAMPATVVVGGVIAYYIRSVLYKKYEISETGLSPEQKRYRKKHIKITSVILSIVILISVASPFAWAFIRSFDSGSFEFLMGVGYQYETKEDAEREYYKLKGYVTGGKVLYDDIIHEEYNEETDTYILYLNEMRHTFEEGKNGYNLTMTGANIMMDSYTDAPEFRFKTLEEMEKFKAENIYDNDNVSINLLQKNVTFDDETLTVTFKQNTNYLNVALDISPLIVIIGSCVFIVVFIISVAIYYRNKKKTK